MTETNDNPERSAKEAEAVVAPSRHAKKAETASTGDRVDVVSTSRTDGEVKVRYAPVAPKPSGGATTSDS